MSVVCLDASMPRDVPRARAIDRQVSARLRTIGRAIGEDLERLRIDSGVSQAALSHAAGVDRSFLGRIVRGDARPSLETLVALSVALGADPSIRIWGGTGPRLTDRHQARMMEALARPLHPVWTPHLEVPVWRPVRGVIDSVLERRDAPLLVLTEVQSSLPRLEQSLRWFAEKAAAIDSAPLFRDRPVPPTSRLLVLRSTRATREVAMRFEATLRVAYPASTDAAVRSLIDGEPWPGDAIVWVRIDGDEVELMAGPPRLIRVGR